MALTSPNSGGNVWPTQNCPAFTPRGGAAEQTCWYCVYADFHLEKPRALDVGLCYWPKGHIRVSISIDLQRSLIRKLLEEKQTTIQSDNEGDDK